MITVYKLRNGSDVVAERIGKTRWILKNPMELTKRTDLDGDEYLVFNDWLLYAASDTIDLDETQILFEFEPAPELVKLYQAAVEMCVITRTNERGYLTDALESGEDNRRELLTEAINKKNKMN